MHPCISLPSTASHTLSDSVSQVVHEIVRLHTVSARQIPTKQSSKTNEQINAEFNVDITG